MQSLDANNADSVAHQLPIIVRARVDRRVVHAEHWRPKATEVQDTVTEKRFSEAERQHQPSRQLRRAATVPFLCLADSVG